MVNRFTATAVERIGAPTELMIAAFSGPVFSNRKKAPNRIAGYISQPEWKIAITMNGSEANMPTAETR